MIIKKRLITKLKTINNGDEVCIFILPDDLYFINVYFDNDQINIEPQFNLPDNKLTKVYKFLNSEFKEKIFSLKESFKTCEYILGFYKNKFYLLFYTYNNIPISYALTRKCANLIGLDVLTPNWEGILNSTVSYAFEEDILIQKK